MRHRTARLVVTAVALTLLLLAVDSTPTVDVAPTAVADRPALALCVEDISRMPDAVRAAVTEVDSLDEVAAAYHRGATCAQDSGARVVRVRHTEMRPGMAAHTSRDAVVVNEVGRVTGYDPYVVVLHELMHGVLWKPHGPDWTDGMHTRRCDSIMSSRRQCILKLDGLTDYDRQQVARKYSDQTGP